jgi:uncharacterized protein (TIRG00374 family)
MTRRQQLFVLFGVLVSIVFLWLAFRNLQPETVLQNISSANGVFLVIGAVWFFASLVVIAIRWGFLLKSIQPVPLGSLISLVSIGYMGNNVYPFRGGEALRIFLVWRNHGVPAIKATTTVLVERVFDGIVMLTFILVGVSVSNIGSDVLRNLASVATPFFAIALIIFFGIATRPNILRMLVDVVKKILPHRFGELLNKLTEQVIGGLEGLRTPADLFGTVVTSYASWMLHVMVYQLVAVAFGINADYGLMMVVVGAVNLAGLIPASPGQVGVFEFVVSQVLMGAGIAEGLAATYALTVHLVIWLPVTLLGFFFLIRQGLNFSAVRQARDLEVVEE